MAMPCWQGCEKRLCDGMEHAGLDQDRRAGPRGAAGVRFMCHRSLRTRKLIPDGGSRAVAGQEPTVTGVGYRVGWVPLSHHHLS